jgi:hypothetical protein
MRHEHYPTIESARINAVLLTDEYQDLPVVIDYDYFHIGKIVVTDFTYDYDPTLTNTAKSTMDFMVKEFIELNHPGLKVEFEF